MALVICSAEGCKGVRSCWRTDRRTEKPGVFRGSRGLQQVLSIEGAAEDTAEEHLSTCGDPQELRHLPELCWPGKQWIYIIIYICGGVALSPHSRLNCFIMIYFDFCQHVGTLLQVEDQMKMLLVCYENKPEAGEVNEDLGAEVKEDVDVRWQSFLQKFLSMQEHGNDFINSANMVSDTKTHPNQICTHMIWLPTFNRDCFCVNDLIEACTRLLLHHYSVPVICCTLTLTLTDVHRCTITYYKIN